MDLILFKKKLTFNAKFGYYKIQHHSKNKKY